jgi:hypothetical protein
MTILSLGQLSAGQLFLVMVIVHLLLDYPLQGDFLAKAKNHVAGVPGVPWTQALFAHAMIQAGGVWLVTGSMTLGVLELIAHAVIDYGKSAGWYVPWSQNPHDAYHIDQGLHVACKVLWILIFTIQGGFRG